MYVRYIIYCIHGNFVRLTMYHARLVKLPALSPTAYQYLGTLSMCSRHGTSRHAKLNTHSAY
jgi:hypothetical protein